MGGHDNRAALSLGLLQKQFGGAAGTFRVEIAGGFVRENEAWLIDQGAGDGDPLFLSG